MTDTIDNSVPSAPPETPRAAREEQYEQAHQQRVEARTAKVAAYEERQAVKEADFAEVRAAREEQYEQAHQQRVEARVAKIAAYNERQGQNAEAARASAERSVHAEETRFRDAQQKRQSGPSGPAAATARPGPSQGPWVSPPTPANATFWNRTRQETDEGGRRWLVNPETGDRVRLDGQLMDDGTVRYPNGDTEPGHNWNRVTAAAGRPAGHGLGPSNTPATGAGHTLAPPTAHSPGVPGEITGLVSAQQYAMGMSAALDSHIGIIEIFVAVLIAADVSGDAITCAVRAQELTLQATQAWVEADAALHRQNVVREAYGAVPEAGDKQWVQQG